MEFGKKIVDFYYRFSSAWKYEASIWSPLKTNIANRLFNYFKYFP